jgi:hypothetical protein
MAKGSNNSTNPKSYMKVAFGRFRQKQTEDGKKVDENTPGAIKREDQQGKPTWAIEFGWLSGKIENIYYKEGGEFEGKKMKNTFEVIIVDAMDKDQVSFAEDSREWFAFAKVLPNIMLDKEVKIKVYDYIAKDKSHKKGLVVEQNDNPNTTKRESKNYDSVFVVNSFYEKWNEDKTVTYLHGFPSGKDVNWKDEDERTIYLMQVKKFLKSEFNRLFPENFNQQHSDIDITETPTTPGQDDDLPF